MKFERRGTTVDDRQTGRNRRGLDRVAVVAFKADVLEMQCEAPTTNAKGSTSCCQGALNVGVISGRIIPVHRRAPTVTRKGTVLAVSEISPGSEMTLNITAANRIAPAKMASRRIVARMATLPS